MPDSTATTSAAAAPPGRSILAATGSSAAPPPPACRAAPGSARTRVTATGRALAREAIAQIPAIGVTPARSAAPATAATTGNVPEPGGGVSNATVRVVVLRRSRDRRHQARPGDLGAG